MELDKITHHVTTAIEINSLFLVQNVIGDQHEMMRNSEHHKIKLGSYECIRFKKGARLDHTDRMISVTGN